MKRAGTLAALLAIALIWIAGISRLGVWRATLQPSDGVLSRTFDGWSTFPVSQHGFLGQYAGDEFAHGRAYRSYSYPFLFSMYAVIGPLHALRHLPFNLAHNVVVYLYAGCLVILLAGTARLRWPARGDPRFVPRLVVIGVAVGLVATTGLLWISLLRYNRDNVHVLAAAAFCYLSASVFDGREWHRPWWLSGLFLALWAPYYVVAWALAGIALNRALTFSRRWWTTLVSVAAVAALNVVLPVIVARLLGIVPGGSSLAYRSGLDGSTRYVTTIPTSVMWPVDPRHWPVMPYLVAAGIGALWFSRASRASAHARHAGQAAFLLIPYATIAIILPQFTSIHPYFTDLLIVVPATFLLAFWSLQDSFLTSLTGPSLAAWVLGAGAVIMTSLLAIAQAFH